MPTHKQGSVDPVTTERDLGRSATNDLQSMFATSPVHTMTADSIRAQYQSDVLDGVTNDGGHTFGEFNKDYSSSPKMEDVPTGGEGLPASPFVPNPSSPGEGSIEPSAQPAAPDGFGQTPSGTPFAGVGSQLDPNASSAAISSQQIGDLAADRSSK